MRATSGGTPALWVACPPLRRACFGRTEDMAAQEAAMPPIPCHTMALSGVSTVRTVRVQHE